MGALQLLPGACIFQALRGATRDDIVMSLSPSLRIIRPRPAVWPVLHGSLPGAVTIAAPTPLHTATGGDRRPPRCPDIATIPPPD
jgi:hypothetical protein